MLSRVSHQVPLFTGRTWSSVRFGKLPNLRWQAASRMNDPLLNEFIQAGCQEFFGGVPKSFGRLPKFLGSLLPRICAASGPPPPVKRWLPATP